MRPLLRRLPRSRALLASYALRAVTIASACLFFSWGSWKPGIATLLIALLMSAPALARNARREFLPLSLDFGIVAFTFISLFLGHVHGLYDRYLLWDKFVHFQSGILFAVGSFVLVYVLNEHERVRTTLSPAFVALFAFAFAVTIGTLWEILEFAGDSLWGTTYWQAGLADTMWDLIADAAGALVIALAGYVWMRVRARMPLTDARMTRR